MVVRMIGLGVAGHSYICTELKKPTKVNMRAIQGFQQKGKPRDTKSRVASLKKRPFDCFVPSMIARISMLQTTNEGEKAKCKIDTVDRQVQVDLIVSIV